MPCRFEEVWRTDLATLQNEFRILEHWIGRVRAAEWRSGCDGTEPGKRRDGQLLNSMTGCVAPANQCAADGGACDDLPEKFSESFAEVFAMRLRRGVERTEGGVEDRAATRGDDFESLVERGCGVVYQVDWAYGNAVETIG